MLNVFINTWGNYNENGADGGEWITLPMDEDELTETLEKIAAAMGDVDPEFCIHDYEWTTDISLREISEMESIEKLNEELQSLGELDEYEQTVFCAMVEYWGYKYSDPDEVENYTLIADINNCYDLGYYFIHEVGCSDLDKMGNLANYFDYEAFGRDINLEADGGFTSYGWIERC